MKRIIPWLTLSVFPFLAACEQADTTPSEHFAVCETRPTTRIDLQGNLDGSTKPNGFPNFVYSIPIIDGSGLPLQAQIEFTTTGFPSWTYQVWGRDLIIGTGSLEFSDEGLLASHEVAQPLRAPELSGSLGPAITLFLGSPLDQGGHGMDGITGYAADSGISRSALNGMDPTVANACGQAEQQPEVQHRDPETGACPGQPTTEIRLVGNLDATAPPGWWGLERAFEWSSFYSSSLVYGPGGVPVAITIFFVKGAGNAWVFHVALGWSQPTRLLTTGTLTFSDTGALVHRQDFSALRIPDGHGELGPPVELKLGWPQDLGADGLSGLTGREAPSAITSVHVDGWPPIVGGLCD
jgi:hypothetical protein